MKRTKTLTGQVALRPGRVVSLCALRLNVRGTSPLKRAIGGYRLFDSYVDRLAKYREEGRGTQLSEAEGRKKRGTRTLTSKAWFD